MRSLARWLAPFALLALAAGATAQQRKPCFVTVVDADDKPIGHAEVTLVEVGHVGADAPDVVRAFTDARGRARPEVVVGRLYSASAMADAAADGSRLVSEPTDRGACGIVLELVAMYRAAPRPLRVVDSEAMKEHWSRGLHVLGADGQSTVVLPVDADGVATLPPSPQAPVSIGIRDATGALLDAHEVAPHEPAPTLKFPERGSLLVDITEADGTPAAGATAALPIGSERHSDALFGNEYATPFSVLARADARGAMLARVPPQFVERYLPAWLRLESTSGVRYLPVPALVATTPAAPVRVQLENTRVVSGSLLGVRANEAAAVRLELAVAYQYGNISASQTLPIDGELAGNTIRAVIPTGTAELGLEVRLFPTDGNGPPRCALASVRTDGKKLANLDLTHLRSFPMHIVAANGDAASSAAIRVGPIPDKRRFVDMKHVVASHAGRAELLLGDGDWGIYVGHGESHAWVSVHRDDPGSALDIRLEPMAPLTLRVVDAEGKPVRGARIESFPYGQSIKTPRMPAERFQQARAQIAVLATMRSAEWQRSNRTGALQIPLQDWQPWTASFRARAGDLVSEPFMIGPGANPGDVVVK